MLVSDVMTTTVVTATTDTPFPELVDLMLRNGISGLPVVDERHRPIGMVTETDLVSKEAYPGRRRLLDVAVEHGARHETIWMEKARGRRLAPSCRPRSMSSGPTTSSRWPRPTCWRRA